MALFLEHFWNTRGLFCNAVGTIKYYDVISILQTLSFDGFVAEHLKTVFWLTTKAEENSRQSGL
jgi:hypothetical protein